MVVTFSLADVACEKTVTTGNPPPPDPTAAQEPTSNPPGPTDDGDAEPESDADGAPEPTGVQSKEKIVDNGDGTCSRYYEVDCPPNVACNPPPPEQVPCPTAD
mgnify:CR=1 FL=1